MSASDSVSDLPSKLFLSATKVFDFLLSLVSENRSSLLPLYFLLFMVKLLVVCLTSKSVIEPLLLSLSSLNYWRSSMLMFELLLKMMLCPFLKFSMSLNLFRRLNNKNTRSSNRMPTMLLMIHIPS